MQENTTPATADSTNIALLPPAQRAVIILESAKAEAHLKDLVAQSSGITAVIDKDGREQAHRAAMNLRNARTAITSTGKAARDDANAFSKAVIAEEKRLIAISQAEEDRIFALRDAYDAEQARIKAEAERKEAERKARIQGMITSIRQIPVDMAGCTASVIGGEINALQAFKADESFAEFADDANAAVQLALATLRDMQTRQAAAEAEAARVAAERAELERQRAEAAAAEVERQRVAAETKRQLEAQQAALAAERKAEADRLQAERDAFEAERRAFQEQQAAAAREAEAKAAPAVQEAEASQDNPQWTAEEQAKLAALDAAPMDFNKIEVPVDTTTSTITVVETVATGDDATITSASTDLLPDEADEAAEAALRAKVTCLDLVVADLLAMNVTADQVRELVDLAIVAAGMKVAA